MGLSKQLHPLSAGLGRAIVMAALLTALGTGHARADFPGDVPDRFKIFVGGVDSRFTTNASLHRTGVPVSASIDFEGVLDLPAYQTDWSVGGIYRFSDRGYIDFGYLNLQRTAQAVLDREVQWGDYTFQVNAQVTTEFGTGLAYLAYRHDFLHLEQVRISGSAGFCYLMLDSGLSAEGGVVDSNGTPITGSVDQQADVSFPVPLLGLQIDWMLTKRTAIQMLFRALYLDYQGFAGGISQKTVRYEWYPSRHFGIGGGIQDANINIHRYKSGDYTAKFQYDVSSLELYFKLAF